MIDLTRNEFLPVRSVAFTYPTDDREVPVIRTDYFVLTATGEVLTNRLSQPMADLVVKRLNQKPPESAKAMKPERNLMTIIIPGLPVFFQDSREVTQLEDGTYRIETSQRYKEAVKKAKKTSTLKRYQGGEVIRDQVRAVMEFTVQVGSHYQLCDLLSVYSRMLYDIGVFDRTRYNMIKSVDGSVVRYTRDTKEFGAIIYLRKTE